MQQPPSHRSSMIFGGSRTSVLLSGNSADEGLSLVLAQHLEEYKFSELKKREAKLLGKLRAVKEQIQAEYADYEAAGVGPATSTSNLSLAAASSLGSEINHQDATIREKNIIEFETAAQESGETLEAWVVRLQHLVVAAYPCQDTETLQSRVAWAFIRGCADHNIRSHLVSQGWTRSPSETLSPGEILALALTSPVVSCEGLLKRKITKAPTDVNKIEKSWSNFYAVLKNDTIFFFKDIKHYRRNEYESACQLTGDTVIEMDDRKGVPHVRIAKDRKGLEIILKQKTEVGGKFPSLECWYEMLMTCTNRQQDGSMKSSRSTNDLQSISPDAVDRRSIISRKDITKKDIDEFLKAQKNKQGVVPPNKTSIQKMLEDRGLEINKFGKSDRKELLEQLLKDRPSLTDLVKKGLVKYMVFGCPIETLCARQGRPVPNVVTQCIEAIEFKGLTNSGIYRINGNNASIQRIRFKFEHDEPVNLREEEFDINMLTGLIKLFLRELPEPVIPFNQYAAIEHAIRLPNLTDTLDTFRSVYNELPAPNKSTLEYIIRHLVRVANIKENLMTANSLSIIFGPSLLGNYPDKAKLLVDLPNQNKAVELFIVHYKAILYNVSQV